MTTGHLARRCKRFLVLWPRAIEGKVCWFKWAYKCQIYKKGWQTTMISLMEHVPVTAKPKINRPMVQFESIQFGRK